MRLMVHVGAAAPAWPPAGGRSERRRRVRGPQRQARCRGGGGEVAEVAAERSQRVALEAVCSRRLRLRVGADLLDHVGRRQPRAGAAGAALAHAERDEARHVRGRHAGARQRRVAAAGPGGPDADSRRGDGMPVVIGIVREVGERGALVVDLGGPAARSASGSAGLPVAVGHRGDRQDLGEPGRARQGAVRPSPSRCCRRRRVYTTPASVELQIAWCSGSPAQVL